MAIEKLSDSSVKLTIDVYDRGNSWVCYFYVYRDTLSITEFTPQKNRVLIESASDCKLQDRYEFVLDGLEKDITYFYRLAAWGNYDVGGPNDSRFDLIGDEVAFKIQ